MASNIENLVDQVPVFPSLSRVDRVSLIPDAKRCKLEEWDCIVDYGDDWPYFLSSKRTPSPPKKIPARGEAFC